MLEAMSCMRGSSSRELRYSLLSGNGAMADLAVPSCSLPPCPPPWAAQIASNSSMIRSTQSASSPGNARNPNVLNWSIWSSESGLWVFMTASRQRCPGLYRARGSPFYQPCGNGISTKSPRGPMLSMRLAIDVIIGVFARPRSGRHSERGQVMGIGGAQRALVYWPRI